MFWTPGLKPKPGSMKGRAIHAVTKAPLSGVHIRLVAGTPDRPAGVYGAVSDRAGHFSITGMPPATYILMPERAGFVYVPPKSGGAAIPSVTLKAGRQVTDFKLEMAPLAAIAGRGVEDSAD